MAAQEATAKIKWAQDRIVCDTQNGAIVFKNLKDYPLEELDGRGYYTLSAVAVRGAPVLLYVGHTFDQTLRKRIPQRTLRTRGWRPISDSTGITSWW
jgi:hypothetical protein